MNNFNKKQKFSIRKYHFGAASVLLGVILGGATAQASEPATTSTTSTPVATTASADLATAKTNLDNANAAVKQQEPAVTSAANAVTKIEQEKAPVKTQLEQEKTALANLANVSTQKAEDDLKVANTKKSDAETALSNAKASDAANQTKIATLDAEVKTANTDVENKQKNANDLKAAAENSFVLDAKVNVSQEFVDALLKRAEYMGTNFNAPIYDKSNPAHVANHDLLTKLGADLLKSNTYTNADTTEVNLWNLTDKQRKEINFFAIDIINQMRKAFGNDPLKITQSMHDFAQYVADNSQRTYEAKTWNPAAYAYQSAVINAAANANGIADAAYKKEVDPRKASLSDEEINKKYQQQQDIILVPDNGGDIYFTYKKTDTAAANVQPIMTMGKLKETIYGQLTRILFTKGDWSENRNWEIALSTVGEFYRQNAKYGSTTVTARVLDQMKDGDWNTKEMRIFVQNHYVADVDAPDTAAGAEHNKIIDPTKFNYTELKNDPAAGQKYDAAKKLLDDAIKLRDAKQNELNTLKAVPSEVAQKQADLDKAIEAVKNAEKALEDAKKLAADTEAEKKAKEQKIADLQKQYDELCAKLKEAQKTLTDETDKLNKLKQDATDADKKYQDLLAKQNQTQPQPPSNNNGGDNGQVTPPSNNNGGNNGQVTPPSNNNGGDNGQVTPPSTGKGGGQYIDLPTLNLPEPPVQGPGNAGNNNGGDNGQVTPPSNNKGGNNGQVTPPSQGNYSGFNQPGKPLRNTGIVLPGVTGGQPANHKYNGRFEAPVSSKSTANALPKTSATTTNSASLPAGLAAALAAAGLLAAKRRKED